MARIFWDIYESALILDTYMQIEKGEVTFKQAVSQLSSDLRKKAIKAGVTVDNLYRNENGIAIQLGCMKYILTDGRHGFSHAPKIYAEIARIYKTDYEQYKQILYQAQNMIK